MPQPAQIRIIEGAHVGDPVFEHRHALDPHPKRKALIFGRIDAAILQYPRVDHAAPEDLEPIAAGADLELAALTRAADIDLGRRLGEREIARAKADRQVVDREEGAEELDQTALQMTHMARAVDDQPLDLMKHRR